MVGKNLSGTQEAGHSPNKIFITPFSTCANYIKIIFYVIYERFVLPFKNENQTNYDNQYQHIIDA